MAIFRYNKKRLVFIVYGELFKGGSRNSATFKMELFTTIDNDKKLKRALCDGLTTNCLLKFAENLSCQTHADARFYTKTVYIVFKDYMIISTYR